MQRISQLPARRRRAAGLAAAAGAFALAGLAFAAAGGTGTAVPADRQPELFAPGVLSTPDDEHGITFTPDGRTAYFTLRSATTTTPPVSVICVSHGRDGRWSEPEVAPFSGLWHDASPAVSPDGAELFFTSDRPLPGRPPSPARGPAGPERHIWVMERTAAGWSAPRSLGPPIESAGGHEAAPAPAADGTLYFASDRAGGKGGYDLYRAARREGRYLAPENLAAVNSRASEAEPAIAPDQSFLVFAAAGRPDALSGGGAPYVRPDLYVSFRRDGAWTAPQSLGPPIDSPEGDSSPSLSPDGRWLYFSSERNFVSVPLARRLTARDFAAGLRGLDNGMGNIYRVDLGAVRALASTAAMTPATRSATRSKQGAR